MNWRLKLWIKIQSGRLPKLKDFFKRIGFFRHGHMESLEYAISVFNRHMNRKLTLRSSMEDSMEPSTPEQMLAFMQLHKIGSGTCLEIGPGESLTTMIVAKAAGFKNTILVDYGWQIESDLKRYSDAVCQLQTLGFDLPDVLPNSTIEDTLLKFNASYLTKGIESMTTLASNSVDFSFSQAVFEHIPKSQVSAYLHELKRIGKRGGFSSHRVDLKDHLGGSIQQLRFSDAEWERSKIYASGVYTNRIRFSTWLKLFEEAQIDYQIVQKNSFSSLPLSKSALSSEFQNLSEVDLCVSGFDVLFRW